MRSRRASSLMWGEALSLLEQAERLHRQFFRVGASQCWEPPVDVIEDEGAVTVYVALPGVPAEAIRITQQRDGVTICGLRRFPASAAGRIHRIEIPYGRFERHIALPSPTLEATGQRFVDGCLVLTFAKQRTTP